MVLSSFKWLIPELLCGSGQPGLLGPLSEDMTWLSETGVQLVVTLTEIPLNPGPEQYGMRGLHFPIPDMGIPTPRQAAQVCREILASMRRAEPVLLHCRAGLGRTGMLLACCLVARGEEPGRAVTLVRETNRNYIQTTAQEKFIDHFAAFLSE